jgi:hypothetical protein
MIVQSSDGYWYQNPRFTTPLAIVEFGDDGCFLYRKGNVSWRTAVKELTKLKIKATVTDDAIPIGVEKIVGGALISTTQFPLRLIKPIPTPHNHETQGTGRPVSDDEEVIWFDEKKRRKRDKVVDDVGGH